MKILRNRKQKKDSTISAEGQDNFAPTSTASMTMEEYRQIQNLEKKRKLKNRNKLYEWKKRDMI